MQGGSSVQHLNLLIGPNHHGSGASQVVASRFSPRCRGGWWQRIAMHKARYDTEGFPLVPGHVVCKDAGRSELLASSLLK
jgi:hypothetical protein